MKIMRNTSMFGMFLLMLITTLPGGMSKSNPMQAALVSTLIFPNSYVTQTGASGGEPVSNLNMMDEFVNDDNPWTYVTFKTPSIIYQGYRRYFLPGSVQRATVTNLRVQVNYKGLAKASQAWTWYLYDWTAKAWVRVGDNAPATANRWRLLTFNLAAPMRFINATTREIRLQVRSNNPGGNAKLDYEALTVFYNPPPAPTATRTSTLLPTLTATPTVSSTPTRTNTPGPSPTPSATLPPGDGNWPPSVPASLILTLNETTGVARVNEVVRSGVPLARSLNILIINQLTIVDSNNTPVPAEFQVLARWNAGLADASAPIQWLLVTFPATVAANQSATYRLVTDGSGGSNPVPAVPLQTSQNGNQVIVNTGAASFTIGGNAGALLDEVRLANNTQLITGSSMSATVNAANTTHSTTRNVTIEHAGPLTAIIVIDGAYNLAAVGGGGLSSQRRYVFTAGSPTVIVRQAVNWEGDLCGNGSNGYDLTCNGNVNGLDVSLIRDTLSLGLNAPFSVTAIGAFGSAALSGTAASGQQAWVRQLLRNTRASALSFNATVPGTGGASGVKADGGLLTVSGAPGAVAIALNHMHRYEPQALRLLSTGQLAIDLADNNSGNALWLGQRQGMFATFAVGALPSAPSRADLDRLVWAPLNHPLRAWPSSAWFASSDATDEFPVAGAATYDALVSSVMTTTRQQIDSKGLSGLMTFGLYPRFWGYPLYSDELDCGDDPTPSESWDNTYWCASWTDYHNTLVSAPTWAMRSGQTDWLDEIAFPGALRMLHTQMMQCSPGDTYFYCGQSPAGYGGYRVDFNSSHAYFDNLFMYYWLTGDYTVVNALKRGSSSMRDYLCSKRPAQACLATDPPVDEWAQLTSRVAMQWFSAFRFIGLASDDASYLDDYKTGLARAITQYYVEPVQNGTSYGFWLDCPVNRASPCPGTRPPAGTDDTGQLWMVSLYDMNVLYRLQRDTNDAPLGSPALTPSHVLTAWARTLFQFGSTVGGGDGTAGGNWPNFVRVVHSGARIGGPLVSVSANVDPDQNGIPCDAAQDECLYTTGKSTLSAVMMRAAAQTGDANLLQMGADFATQALSNAQTDISPLGKIIGEYLARLHAAVARLAP